MSPPDTLCHWEAWTQQQKLCLSHGDLKLPRTPVSQPGLHGLTGGQGLPHAQQSQYIPLCILQRGQLAHPRGGHPAASPGRHTSASAYRCHSWAPQVARAVSAALHSWCALCVFFGNKITACCTSFRLLTFALSYAHKTVCDTPYQLDDQHLAQEWPMNCFSILAGNCCKNVSR